MKKLVSLLLALVLICSLIPMTALAATFNPAEYKVIVAEGNKWIGYKAGDTVGNGGTDVTKDFKKFLADQEKAKHDDDDDEVTLSHGDEGDEIIGYGCDTKYHWLQCACGCKIGEELHVDPKDTTDDTCTCGYHFSDNADLVTLWVKNCPEIKDFDKNQTEYKLNA